MSSMVDFSRSCPPRVGPLQIHFLIIVVDLCVNMGKIYKARHTCFMLEVVTFGDNARVIEFLGRAGQIFYKSKIA